MHRSPFAPVSRVAVLVVLTGACATLAACRPSSASEGTRAAEATVKPSRVGTDPGGVGPGTPLAPRPGHELAAFAEGCFWGSENTFRHVTGVVATAVGYTGGTTSNPTYDDVCSHATGHAEAVLVEFDPRVVSYRQLVGVFFRSHDPTTRDRQGPDFGDQYRSAIFTTSPAQEAEARAGLGEAQKEQGKPIVTQIAKLPAFWKAEGYHQQYDEKTGRESCPSPKILGI